MSYISKTLVPGEKVVYQTKLHWIVMFGHIVGALVLWALGICVFWYVYAHQEMTVSNRHVAAYGGAALLICGLILLFAGSLRRNVTEMAVTTRRVVVKTGLASRRTIEMLLNKVETIEVAEPGLGRMLGYGSITMIGTGGTSEQFHKIARPLVFRNEVQQQIERLGPIPSTPASPAVPASDARQ
ncbi:MAG: PH domain-containing protein [Acidobacteriota bacterium]